MFGQNSGQRCNLTVRYVQTPTEPIIGNIQFHKLNLMVSGSCSIFAFVLITGLMWCHATHLSNPKEQLDIMRIATLIPCYAILTLAAVYDANAWPFVKPWIEVCQGYALANFWILICRFTMRLPSYAEKHQQGAMTRTDSGSNASSISSSIPQEQEVRDVFFAPLLALSHKQRRRPLTLTRYRRHWVYIMQGPIVMFLVAACTNIIEPLAYTCKLRRERALRMALSCTSIASMVMSMWTAIRHCGTLRSELWPYRAMFKMLSFKLILGLYIILQVIYMFLDAVKPSPLEPTRLLNTADIEVGVPLMATCCELALFAVFFCWSYSVTPYLLPASSSQAAPPTSSLSPSSAPAAVSASPSLSTSETLTGAAADPESHVAQSTAVLSEKQQGQEEEQQQQHKQLRYHGGFCGLKAWLMMLNHMDMLKGFLFPFVYMEEAALGGYTGQAPRLRKEKWRYMWYYKLSSCWSNRKGGTAAEDKTGTGSRVVGETVSDQEVVAIQDTAR